MSPSLNTNFRNNATDLRFDEFLFTSNLQNYNNHKLLNSNVNIAFDNFFRDIEDIEHNSMVPLNRKGVPQKKRAPWASADLVYLSKEKEKLYRMKLKRPTDTELLLKYKYLCKLVNKKNKSDKIKYFDKKLAKCEGDQRKYWMLVKEEMRMNRKHSEVCSVIINGENILVKDNEERWLAPLITIFVT